MPLFNIAGKYADALGSGIQSAVAEGFNMLPDRINLFGRYLTGVGNKNLKLDPSTERALLQATEKPPTAMRMVPTFPDEKTAFMGDFSKMTMAPKPFPAAGPGIPTSGPVYPYAGGDQVASQTLGSFNAEVTPTAVRVRDTYDMENRSEDPDLVSGRFQPGKAYKTLRGAFDPTKIYNPKIDKLSDISHRLTPEQKQFDNYINVVGKSTTFSPMTDVGRAVMYALPIKFKPYEIDYTIQRPQ
tara:strand:+ start:226 stop:951 length:726 start_codon:yes stop_codon:yes gene_type:complete